MNENKTDIWVEKYRPTNFNDIVLSPINRKIFKNIIDMDYFPNLLFYGPPGTGKTTTIINLINEYQSRYSKINSSTIIHLNASDERGIDIIRNQINQFVKSMNLFENGLKFVILDEVDYMTKNAQQALKYILQTSIHNVRFCLICNYISKIDESLKNEFICVRFNQLPPEYICNFLQSIITKECIYLKPTTIQSIQKMYGSDIRSMINFIQLNQNLNIEDWERNIITDEDFSSLHEVIMNSRRGGKPMFSLLRSATKENERERYIHMISVQYNIDKKSLLLKYYDWVLRNRKDELLNERIDEANSAGDDRSKETKVSPTDDRIFRSVTKENEMEENEMKENGENRDGYINDFFERMENIIHNTGDVPIEILWGQV
jgi:DNA polymerase III delta prime subunit